MILTTLPTLLGIIVFSPPPPSPSPPLPPLAPPPSPNPPPTPPSETFHSNDALLGCSRSNHKLSDGSYHYGTGDLETMYTFIEFNDTGLHNLRIHVDSATCVARARVFLPHAQNGHTYSLYTSKTGTSWNLVSELVYQVDSPPPPAPSPPPPSPQAPPIVVRRLQELSFGELGQGIHELYFSHFNVSKEPMYVRACIDCDGSCNGVDTIDSLVTCNAALPSPTPPSQSPENTIPWWSWLFVASTAILIVGLCAAGAQYAMQQSAQGKATPVPARKPGSRSIATRPRP